eukprot:6178181-Pleurochrysis_carterae.AAC.1
MKQGFVHREQIELETEEAHKTTRSAVKLHKAILVILSVTSAMGPAMSVAETLATATPLPSASSTIAHRCSPSVSRSSL